MPQKKFLTILLVALILSCADAHAARRVALVIGNAAYKTSPLRNPVNDAKDVAAALKGLGFEVICKTDAGKRAMVDGVNAFGLQAQGADVALFFYAGHGMQVNGINYLIPLKADVRNEEDVEFEALQADRVLAKMEKAGAKVNLVLLDACRENPFRGFRAASRGLAVVRAVSGSVIVYATAPGDVAADGSGRNSPFTAHLLRHLATPGVTVKAVFDRVGAGVADDTKGRQMPWVSSSLYRDVYLAGPPSEGDQAAPPPASSPQVAMAPRPAPPEQPAPAPETPEPTGNRQGDTWADPVTGMEFLWVPGGCFQMGSNSGKDDEKPVHEVCVDGFWMGRYEATRGQFREFVRRTGYRSDAEKGGGAFIHTGDAGEEENKAGCYWDKVGFEQDDRHPVATTTWNDATAYAQWLSGKGNGAFRLPTEAEWEYAARAGTTTARYWGDDSDQACRHANVLDRTSKLSEKFRGIAHNCDDGYEVTAPVGSFKSNAFGLHDMLGNVLEWCADGYDKDAYSKHVGQNPLASGDGFFRVIRGGSWFHAPGEVRSANRYGTASVLPSDFLGFRLVRTE